MILCGRKRRNMENNETSIGTKELNDQYEGDGIGELSGLPERDLFRVSEVASYFSVSERTIRLWIEHKLINPIEKVRGTVWVPRTSIIKFRLKARTS